MAIDLVQGEKRLPATVPSVIARSMFIPSTGIATSVNLGARYERMGPVKALSEGLENTWFIVHGQQPEGGREKRDTTSQ